MSATDWRIDTIDSANDQRLAGIIPLFEAMYAEMERHGPVKRLSADGARIWLNGVATGLERFGRLSVAVHGDVVVGFAHGSVKLGAEHQGGERIGYITHVHVAEQFRRVGMARALVASLEEWFRLREVRSREIQIVAGNAPAAAFWERLGYTCELVQYAVRG